MEQINKTFWLNYLRPNNYIKSINDVDFELLHNNGTRVVICDLDNTLAPTFKKWPFKATVTLVKYIKSLGMRFFIVSNNVDRRVKEYVEKLEKEVKIDGYLSGAWKPFLFKLNNFFNKFEIDYSETIFIGDQFITDIIVANRFKSKSILVLSLIDTSEIGFWNHILFLLEKFIYKKLAHENQLIKPILKKVEEPKLL